jgi:hypothetical protein
MTTQATLTAEETDLCYNEFTRQMTEEDPDCSDNCRICDTEDECSEMHVCCGTYNWSFTLPSGRIVWLGYDYGH